MNSVLVRRAKGVATNLYYHIHHISTIFLRCSSDQHVDPPLLYGVRALVKLKRMHTI